MDYGQGYSGGFVGTGGAVGDVAMRYTPNPTALQALESAVAIPDAYTTVEMERTLRRNKMDVMKTALQLKDKHVYRRDHHYDQLNVGMEPIQLELKKGYVHFLDGAKDYRNCPIVLLLLKYFKPDFQEEGGKTQLKHFGSLDGSSSLEDTRRLCVYLLDLACETMEENRSDGVMFVIDLDQCNWQQHVTSRLFTDLFSMLKSCYPEIVQRILLINGNALIVKTLPQILSTLGIVSDATYSKIIALKAVDELRHFIPMESLPQLYGGSYRLLTPLEFMKIQAEIEEVDLKHNDRPLEQEKQYMTKEARALCGMQYAACSAEQVLSEMKTNGIRGPLYRKKTEGNWVKLYGILRPDALLLYESVSASKPLFIIGINEQVVVNVSSFNDLPRGAFGFKTEVVVGHQLSAGSTHCLAACSELERSNWCQEIQVLIKEVKDEIERERREEERKLREQKAFEKFNMISFEETSSSPPHGPVPMGAPTALSMNGPGQGMPMATPMSIPMQNQMQPMGPTAPMTTSNGSKMVPNGPQCGMYSMGMMPMPQQQQLRMPQPVNEPPQMMANAMTNNLNMANCASPQQQLMIPTMMAPRAMNMMNGMNPNMMMMNNNMNMMRPMPAQPMGSYNTPQQHQQQQPQYAQMNMNMNMNAFQR